jgi:hypothetical protein
MEADNLYKDYPSSSVIDSWKVSCTGTIKVSLSHLLEGSRFQFQQFKPAVFTFVKK